MNEACSVVFVHSPFVVLFEGKELSLESGSALLVRGGAGSLLPFSECFRRISLSESTIIRYLLCGDEKQDVVLVRQIPRYLCVSFPKAELMGILIDYLCEEKIHTDNLAEMLSFSCLAFFSSEKMFSSFLTACIGNISDRLSALFRTDIAANWTLRDVSSQLCISESLLKKRLKEEGTCFSELLLTERMRMAAMLLNQSRCAINRIAAQCGYNFTSYFISVFRSYFGVTPAGYRMAAFNEMSLSVTQE
ncbi:TPA: AraC family transcriptional regulator [Escherichia coli]|uniref:AraC family transcriptional regulator n=1 Tax=Escherichia coli TaxID=562 RepID=UPI00044B7488|nr:AraC family transcriptional regulator [Escherichia coli]EHN5054779.1 AraC family transcriptional regulator [Escherichia coli]EZE09868.1 AraC family transcriptional regulator [Escherichia coli O121:H7 str. 2009C-3299]HBP9792749.1 AraC family transcriptional regulator [Escherichia coli]